MPTIKQRMDEVELEIKNTKKNKATEHHLGLLKAKLAKLKREFLDQASKKKGQTSAEGFEVPKAGHARIGMIGFPSVGKSTLLTNLTPQSSEINEKEFTTLTCIPGFLIIKGAKFQLLDLPGIIEGAKDNRGKGRQIVSVARSCDLLLVVLDANHPVTHKLVIERELEGFGIRLNKKPPKIQVNPQNQGGLNLSYKVK